MVFLRCAFTFAQLARCAAAIFLPAEATWNVSLGRTQSLSQAAIPFYASPIVPFEPEPFCAEKRQTRFALLTFPSVIFLNR